MAFGAKKKTGLILTLGLFLIFGNLPVRGSGRNLRGVSGKMPGEGGEH